MQGCDFQWSLPEQRGKGTARGRFNQASIGERLKRLGSFPPRLTRPRHRAIAQVRWNIGRRTHAIDHVSNRLRYTPPPAGRLARTRRVRTDSGLSSARPSHGAAGDELDQQLCSRQCTARSTAGDALQQSPRALACQLRGTSQGMKPPAVRPRKPVLEHAAGGRRTQVATRKISWPATSVCPQGLRAKTGAVESGTAGAAAEGRCVPARTGRATGPFADNSNDLCSATGSATRRR